MAKKNCETCLEKEKGMITNHQTQYLKDELVTYPLILPGILKYYKIGKIEELKELDFYQVLKEVQKLKHNYDLLKK